MTEAARWWLEGEPGNPQLGRVVEYGPEPCPMPAPDKADHAWLSAHGVGLNPPHGDAVRWAELVTHLRPPRALRRKRS